MSKRYLLGLLGHPVGQSISPIIHKAAFKSAGLEGNYELHDVDSSSLEEFIERLKRQNYSGLNVTIPHKLKVMNYVDVLSNEAVLVGAVNTIKFDSVENRLLGYNTDVIGFKSALLGRVKNQCPVLVYGYGGSSRAILVALAELGYDKIYITGRSDDKVMKLVSSLGPQIESFRKACQIRKFDTNVLLSDIGLLVNCSPMGQNDNLVSNNFVSCLEGMAPRSGKDTQKFVFDLVYSKERKKDTKVVHLAKEHGMAACDGYEMLIHQALRSFELWTGRKVERASIEAHLSF